MNKKFRVAGNVINELSEKIPSNVIALNELIKNSYDASAKEVTVTLDTQKMTLSIADDGDGMDDSEIDALLQLSKSNKKYGTINPINNRYVQGSKGLGFLAVFKFGNFVRWITVKKAEKRVFQVAYQEVIELEDLSDYSIEVSEELNVEEKNGTRIDITLRDFNNAGLLKAYLKDPENLDKLLNAFLDDGFVINIIIDGVEYTTKKERSLLGYYPENRFFYVAFDSTTQNINIKCYDHYAYKNIDVKDSSILYNIGIDSRVKFNIRLMIFDFSNNQKSHEPDKQFSINGKLTPLIFVNKNFFSNYNLFDPDILRSIQSKKSLPQMIGYVEIISSDEKIQFNSDRTQFQENELTIAIQKTLKDINRFIQTQCSYIKSGYDSTKGKQAKEPGKEKPSSPNQDDKTPKPKSNPDAGTNPNAEPDSDANASQKQDENADKEENEAQAKTKSAVPVVLKINSLTNQVIPSHQMNLEDLIISATDSNGVEITLDRIKILVDGDECKSRWLQSVNQPCIKKVSFCFTDAITGLEQQDLSIVFIEKPLQGKSPERFLIPNKAHKDYVINFKTNPIVNLVSQINALYGNFDDEYNEVVACSLRSLFELSLYELELNQIIRFKYSNDLGKRVASFMREIKGNVTVLTAIYHGLKLPSYTTFTNELSAIDFDAVVTKCHLGAHKSTSAITKNDFLEIGTKAALFIVVANEVLNNPQILWGKNGQPYEIAVK